MYYKKIQADEFKIYITILTVTNTNFTLKYCALSGADGTKIVDVCLLERGPVPLCMGKWASRH
jgi:hypothetical protein